MSASVSMAGLSARRATAVRGVTIDIGDIPVLLRCGDSDFRRMLERRYAGFVNPEAAPVCEFDVELADPTSPSDEDVQVSRDGSIWSIRRGDFRAEWDVKARRGYVRQTPNPYSIDTVLRIVHSLVLAEEGGFLLHAASAVRSGQAYLFSGISGAGKTTISRLAPSNVAVLTDEVSYVRRRWCGYRAYGTPFAGELARVGENLSAAFGAVYFLEKGPANRIDPIDDVAAVRALLRNILFFSHDEQLVRRVFDSAFEFVSHVATARLTFRPDVSVWRLIG